MVVEDGSDVEVGETSDRGVGITRNAEGGEIVVPQRGSRPDGDQPESVPRRGVTFSTQQQRDARLGNEARQEIGRARRRDLSPEEILAAQYSDPRPRRRRRAAVDTPEPVGPVDRVVDTVFSDSEEVASYFGLTSEAAREDRVDVGGPSIQGLFEGRVGAERDPADPQVVRSLTQGSGPLSDTQRQNLREDIETRANWLSDIDNVFESVAYGGETDRTALGRGIEGATGSEQAGTFVSSAAGSGADVLLTGSAEATLAADSAINTAQNLPETVSEEGAGSVAEASVAVGGAALAGGLRRFQQQPAETAGSVAGEIVAPTAALRGASRVGSAARSARVRAQADEVVELEEITDETGTEGDLPQFETDTGAPTSEAVDEVRARAADNPEVVTEAVGTERTLYHSTEADLGEGFEASRGSSELPGLFTSPDASPLRLAETEATSRMPSFRLPRGSDFTGERDRFAAFEGDRITGMPEEATGSGRIPDGEGGYTPDPETGGARFLDDDAEAGTAYVRPTGSRTTELEAIFPPGSRFEAPRERVSSISERALRQSDTDTRDVFGRPLASDVGATPITERALRQSDTDTRDVFGRPLRQDVDAEVAVEGMDSRDAFGRPLASDVGATPISERVTPTGTADRMGRRDVFGQPLASDVGATPLSTRAGSVLSAATPESRASGSPSRATFGRPLASDVGATPISERVTPTGTADRMGSRDVFGRPLRQDVDAEVAVEGMDTRDVFGRPITQDVSRPAERRAVELPGGRTVPLDTFRRADADGPGRRGRTADRPDDTVSASRIYEEYSSRRRNDPDGSPVAPPTGLGSSMSSAPSRRSPSAVSSPVSPRPSGEGRSGSSSLVESIGSPSGSGGSGSSGSSLQSSLSGGGSSMSSPFDPSGGMSSSASTPSGSGGGFGSSGGSGGGSTTITVSDSGLTTRPDDTDTDDDRSPVDVSGWAEKEQRDLINPFTGE
jgi:hypothetical protein